MEEEYKQRMFMLMVMFMYSFMTLFVIILKVYQDLVSQPIVSSDSGADDLLLYERLDAQFMVGVKRKRRIGEWYIFPRVNCWFDSFVIRYWDDRKWRRHFRMSRENFQDLRELLRPRLERMGTNCKLPVPVEKQVACALMRMAKNSPLYDISEMMGLGVSTVHYCIYDVVNAIVAHPDLAIEFPSGIELERVIKGFKDKHGFPNCVGAIDCSHLCHKRPPGYDGGDYFDRNRRFSTIMQAVVGPDCKFQDVFVGYPGSAHDSRVVKDSKLWDEMETRMHQSSLVPPVRVGREDVGGYILGDSGYPLRPWLIVPFDVEDTANKRFWNYCHSSTRMVVERTFGIFKSMWRIFNDAEAAVRHRPNLCILMAHACTRLHNWLIDIGEIQILPLEDPTEEDYELRVDDWDAEELDELLADAGGGQAVRTTLYEHIMEQHDREE